MLASLVYCKEKPLDSITDVRKLLFYKRLMRADNKIISLVFSLAQNDTKPMGSKFNVALSRDSVSKIKLNVWKTFIAANGLDT